MVDWGALASMLGSKRVFGELRRLGLIGSISYYIPRLVSGITAGRCKIFPIAFYVQPVHTEKLVSKYSENAPTVGVLSSDSVPESSFGRPEGVVSERFDSGHICIGAVKDANLLGFMWISPNFVRERLVRCVFEPGPAGHAAWDYDFFIAPRYRLGRTFARLWDEARDYLNTQGFRASVSWIELSNVESTRAHMRLGARRAGWAVFVTIWNTQITFCSVSPYFHWSAPGGEPVRIRVDTEAIL